MQPIILSII